MVIQELPYITYPAMMENREGVIHRDINENETETNNYTLDKFIKECPGIKSPAMMEYCGKEELDDNKKKQ